MRPLASCEDGGVDVCEKEEARALAAAEVLLLYQEVRRKVFGRKRARRSVWPPALSALGDHGGRVHLLIIMSMTTVIVIVRVTTVITTLLTTVVGVL